MVTLLHLLIRGRRRADGPGWPGSAQASIAADVRRRSHCGSLLDDRLHAESDRADPVLERESQPPRDESLELTVSEWDARRLRQLALCGAALDALELGVADLLQAAQNLGPHLRAPLWRSSTPLEPPVSTSLAGGSGSLGVNLLNTRAQQRNICVLLKLVYTSVTVAAECRRARLAIIVTPTCLLETGAQTHPAKALGAALRCLSSTLLRSASVFRNSGRRRLGQGVLKAVRRRTTPHVRGSSRRSATYAIAANSAPSCIARTNESAPAGFLRCSRRRRRVRVCAKRLPRRGHPSAHRVRPLGDHPPKLAQTTQGPKLAVVERVEPLSNRGLPREGRLTPRLRFLCGSLAGYTMR